MENDPKTNAGLRTIQLDPATVAELKAYRIRVESAAVAQMRLDALSADSRVFPDWYFTARVGHQSAAAAAFGVICPRRVYRCFVLFTERAGLPRIRLHDLRHTSASLAVAAGHNPKTVQERLGHSHIATTLSTYSHISEAVHKAAAEELGAMMFPPTSDALKSPDVLPAHQMLVLAHR